MPLVAAPLEIRTRPEPFCQIEGAKGVAAVDVLNRRELPAAPVITRLGFEAPALVKTRELRSKALSKVVV